MKTGLFGGTFDPPHNGHLVVAQDAMIALRLDRILFIPAAIPPHKVDVSISPAARRARMLELAIGDDQRFGVDRLELERNGPSWTVDTLRAVDWTLLIGADQYAEFETWREPEAVRSLARVAVLARGGTDGRGPVEPRNAHLPAPGAVELGNGDVRVDVTRVDISATAVRQRVAAGLPIRYLVPSAVEAFIFEHRLYAETAFR